MCLPQSAVGETGLLAIAAKETTIPCEFIAIQYILTLRKDTNAPLFSVWNAHCLGNSGEKLKIFPPTWPNYKYTFFSPIPFKPFKWCPGDTTTNLKLPR